MTLRVECEHALLGMMHAADAWGRRWSENQNIVARRYMELAVRKQSLVVLAADCSTMSGMRDLLEQVADSSIVLKTHVDLIEDWSLASWMEIAQRARDLDMLIFEDRKFADIARISQLQMTGIHGISEWADLVTAHMISGPDMVEGLAAAWNSARRDGGVLLLAQMSSRGNLLDEDYSRAVVATGSLFRREVAGYIGNGSDPEDVGRLRVLVGESQLIWTPGIHIDADEGERGQRYGGPRESVLAGSDALIVGSGIHSSGSPADAARQYAAAGWDGLMQRMGGVD